MNFHNDFTDFKASSTARKKRLAQTPKTSELLNMTTRSRSAQKTISTFQARFNDSFEGDMLKHENSSTKTKKIVKTANPKLSKAVSPTSSFVENPKGFPRCESSPNLRTPKSKTKSKSEEAILGPTPVQIFESGQISDPAQSKNAEFFVEELEDDSCDISRWGLPDSVVLAYQAQNVMHMFKWQADCLMLPNVLNGGNLVYSAPTSAGKTLVAEILMLKKVTETKKKGLMILPFVSVAREKMTYLQKLFADAGITVDGYMGTHNPPGGFNTVDIAICTIEKANNLINRLMEDGRLANLGIIVVDELHMLGDPHRGYLLELLLTKLLYMCKKNDLDKVQIVGMSATLPNLNVLAAWLQADLYHTNYRPVPLQETFKVGSCIYDSKSFDLIRDMKNETIVFPNDSDHTIYLAIETVTSGHSVLVFCPTKNWCEKLAESIAKNVFELGRKASDSDASSTEFGLRLHQVLEAHQLQNVLDQLKNSPAGLDAVLGRTVPFGVAFHHAGLTFDERDIVESAFRYGILKFLVATSTLSSGVNLPAKRVIIRSPLFCGKLMDVLSYKQMVGRAGRKGIDSSGESILICKETERNCAKNLVESELRPVKSCLVMSGDDSLHSSMKRAILEVIASKSARTKAEIMQYMLCTLLSASIIEEQNDQDYDSDRVQRSIDLCLKYLIDNQFVNKIMDATEGNDEILQYKPTRLGLAVLSSGFSPDDSLRMLKELELARQCFVLENDLHILYEVTPPYLSDQLGDMNWLNYLSLWEQLSDDMKRVGKLVGIEEQFLGCRVRGQARVKTERELQKLAVHQRFYACLALNDLIQEVPLGNVANKYNCTRGILQSLQQTTSTFAGMLTVFCSRLGWCNLELLFSQFQKRVHFGIQPELCDLVRLATVNGQRARVLYNGGYETVAAVANATVPDLTYLLTNTAPFESAKGQEWLDNDKGEEQKCVFISGRKGMTRREAASAMILEAQQMIQQEFGKRIQWNENTEKTTVNTPVNSETEQAKNQDSFCLDKTSEISIQSKSSSESPCPKSREQFDPSQAKDVNIVQETKELKRRNNTSTENKSLLKESIVEPKRTKLNDNTVTGTNFSFFDHDSFDCSTSLLGNDDLKLTKKPDEDLVNQPEDLANEEAILSQAAAMESIYFTKSFYEYLDNVNDSALDDSKSTTQEKDSQKQIKAQSSTPLGPKLDTDLLLHVSPVVVEDNCVNTEDDLFTDDTQFNSDVSKIVNCNEDELAEENSAELFTLSLLTQETSNAETGLPGDAKLNSDVNEDDVNENSDDSSYSSVELFMTSTASYECRTFEKNADHLEQKILQLSGCNQDLKVNQDSFYIDRNIRVFNDDVSIRNSNVIEEWKKVSEFSFSVVCEKLSVAKSTIGPQKRNEKPKCDYMFGSDLKVKALCLCFGSNLINYFPFDCKCSVSDGCKRRRDLLQDVFENCLVGKTVIAYDIRHQCRVLAEACGINIDSNGSTKFEDPLIAAWMLDPNSGHRQFQELVAQVNLVDEFAFFYDEENSPPDLKDVLCSEIARKCILEVAVVFPLMEELSDRLHQKKLHKAFTEIEMPLQLVISKMELSGIGFNDKMTITCRYELEKQQSALREKAFQLAGHKFDLMSTVNVARVLYKELKLIPDDFTSSPNANRHLAIGVTSARKRQRLPPQLKTNKSSLEKLKHLHPLPGIILDYRKIGFSISQVLTPLLMEKKIHNGTTLYRLHGTSHVCTVTGRVNMHSPNLQFVPRNFDVDKGDVNKDDSDDVHDTCLNSEVFGVNLRNVFTAFPGNLLLSADYRQLELRLLAHFSSDQKLLKALNDSEDIFVTIASIWKKINITQVTSQMRHEVKQICYGIIYGIGAKTLSQQLKTDEESAELFMKSFKSSYPGVKQYLKNVVEKCRETGYVSTLANRRRELPSINSQSSNLRSRAERQAVNTTIQGSAADLVKLAMIRIDSELREKYPETRHPFSSKLKKGTFLVLQLHDELIFEVPRKDLQNVAILVKRNMENCFNLSVKLSVKLSIGQSWGNLEEINT